MLRLSRRSRRDRKIKKVQKGDNHALKDYRIWHIFTRSLFHIELTNERNETIKYAIDYKYYVEEPAADLYRDGKHIAYSKLPAAFPVEDGVIEVASGSYGIKRMHYVTDEEEAYPMYPDKRSVRGLRMGLDNRFPRTSKFIGILSVLTLLGLLAVSSPQLLESISQVPWINENIGAFESPIKLSVWENFAVGIVASLAGTERALMLRTHWLYEMI